MSAITLKTFDDIIDACAEELKIQSSDTTNRNRIKRLVNEAYGEVCGAAQWTWLRGRAALIQFAAISDGTVAVTEGSTALTFTSAPALSRVGHLFSVTGDEEVYRIAAHTAGATTAKLAVPYQGADATAASYNIWTDALALPADARETFNVSHDNSSVPLTGVGLQKYKEHTTADPKREGRPEIYSTSDFKEPVAYAAIAGLPALSTRASAGFLKTLVFASTVAAYLEAGDRIEISGAGSYAYNGEAIVASVSTTTVTYVSTVALSEAAAADLTLTTKLQSNENSAGRYRELLVHPSRNTQDNTILNVEYIRDLKPMEDDADEPVMPILNRVALKYGALAKAWGSIQKDEAQQARNQGLYDQTLARMKGKVDDSTDYPRLSPSKTYLARKRAGSRRRCE